MRKILLMALSLVGLFDSIYLMWEYTSPANPMVCMGGGCDAVRASAYAHLGGLPVPLYGVFMYGFLVLLLFLFPLLPTAFARLTQYIVLLISGAAFLFSVYLTGIEAFVLHAWCMWCVLSALLVTAIFLLSIVERARPPKPLEPARALSAVQRNFALILFGFVLGVPAFIMLTSHGSMPAAKPPTTQTVQKHLVRPDTHFYGNPNAKVTVVEFGDFKCPACRQAEASAKKVREKFGNKIRFAFREFPLVNVHAESEKAAEAAECAGQQGKFWQAVDMFYQHQQDLSPAALNRYAGEMGLNSQKFVVCLQKGEMKQRVNQDLMDGQALGVHATPTFFIDGQMIVGPIPYPQFTALLENELNKEGVQQATPGNNSKPTQQEPASSAAKPREQEKAAASQQSAGKSTDTMQVLGGSSNLLAGLQDSAAACSEEEAKKRQPKMIGTSQAEKLYGDRSQTLFVDVRSAKDFESGHIPGALNLPIDSFAKQLTLLPKNKRIVLYQGGESGGDVCAFSRSAGRVLLSRGFGYNDVNVYRDGLAGWKKAGLPIKR
ncbi:MAG: thioredoxin domain-containing protein [Acidobacteria bacterium]|nr:thioredoxin domain-containing protein [Acidobacteriota bacterium]